MQHCTPEQLALAALREPLPDEDAAHLESCAVCTAEVASLRRGVDAVAVPQLAAPGASVAPPAHVWDAIVAATGVSGAPAAVTEPPVTEPPAGAEVLPFRARRRPLLIVAASLLVGAVVGAGAVAVVRATGDRESEQPVESVALDPLDGNEASGQAEVVRRDDGSRALEVRLTAPALHDGYYEVWLIEPSITDMVSLGVARSGTSTFELPSDLNLAQFPLVDVSEEPLDGNPLHSGVSVARGQLEG